MLWNRKLLYLKYKQLCAYNARTSEYAVFEAVNSPHKRLKLSLFQCSFRAQFATPGTLILCLKNRLLIIKPTA